MLHKLISNNYDLEVKNLSLIDHHFGTEVFLAETSKGKFIVKTLPLGIVGMENEGHITEYLLNNDISVARLLKANNGMYHIETDNLQFHIQEYIQGETLRVNTAPSWFIEKSAHLIGKIHYALNNYSELKTSFGLDFFNDDNVNGSIRYYSEMLNEANKQKDDSLIYALEERLKHLKRISTFVIDVDKLTYSNSHGDFHIGQIITNNENLTVIDWTSASKLPICLEVITSYVTSDPECKSGQIDSNRLKRFIDNYSKYFSLSSYDVEIMPYLLYYQQLMCHYTPPYRNVADSYKPICELINNFTNWLYHKVDTLSKELC
ncbi:MAG: kinaselike protein [Herbinix sp.]|jgi:Ser/Thr protein kinase RdoA (MazF antagonist)|nr:kinaselike protein [Herbinix sp.]